MSTAPGRGPSFLEEGEIDLVRAVVVRVDDDLYGRPAKHLRTWIARDQAAAKDPLDAALIIGARDDGVSAARGCFDPLHLGHDPKAVLAEATPHHHGANALQRHGRPD